MNQTAVEWLEQEFIALQNYGINELGLFSKAKAMEIEQHKETFKQSRQAKIFEKDMPPVWESFEHYYNETYGK
jgi:hypothetical protein